MQLIFKFIFFIFHFIRFYLFFFKYFFRLFLSIFLLISLILHSCQHYLYLVSHAHKYHLTVIIQLLLKLKKKLLSLRNYFFRYNVLLLYFIKLHFLCVILKFFKDIFSIFYYYFTFAVQFVGFIYIFAWDIFNVAKHTPKYIHSCQQTIIHMYLCKCIFFLCILFT